METMLRFPARSAAGVLFADDFDFDGEITLAPPPPEPEIIAPHFTAEDVESADASGVTGTPSFFVNGKRHHGSYDLDSLTSAVRAAQSRAAAREHVRETRR